ncbi:fimbria/pilus outer membrane usher protein [Escherichia coli]|nr:fimbria/pilus outer membrane usher protein [Escherichia coli]
MIRNRKPGSVLWVNLSYQNQGNETTAGANLTWNAPVATVNGSYSQSSTYRQAGASVSGGIVAWSGALIWRTVFPKRLL